MAAKGMALKPGFGRDAVNSRPVKGCVVFLALSLVAACSDSAGTGDVASSGAEEDAHAMTGSVVQGRFTAQRWCSSCHQVDATAPGVEAGAPAFVAVANRPDTTRSSLLDFMDETHPVYSLGAPIDMPTDVLYEREKADLVAYIVSLRQTDD
ncbi:hypothetical protein [Fodinicurvata sp. EGI_FJ10296]|uniref:hypothetical protein n=1 Tax=Fodinicurvata sp. EGI_FJ10296 TaxID=3231908 RepID=UPI003451F573